MGTKAGNEWVTISTDRDLCGAYESEGEDGAHEEAGDNKLVVRSHH